MGKDLQGGGHAISHACLVGSGRASLNRRSQEDYVCAQIAHLEDEEEQAKFTDQPGFQEWVAEGNESFRRRLRGVAKGGGKRSGNTSPVESFMVANWLQMAVKLPGLCFFSDAALHDLLALLSIARKGPGGKNALKQTRVRLGLVQAGWKSHLVGKVKALGGELALIHLRARRERTLYSVGTIRWKGRVQWPPVN